MARTIYGLYCLDPEAPGRKKYFYVGRSIDIFRREKQHHYAKAAGHEDKYAYIRQIESEGIGWYTEALREIPDGEYPPDNERWYVIKLTREGHALMNMRHGSAEHRRELAAQVQMMNIRSVADVRAFRILRKYAASRRLKRRILEAALRTEGIPSVLGDSLLPPILRKRLLAQHCTKIGRGVTLSGIVSLVRAHSQLMRLLDLEKHPS